LVGAAMRSATSYCNKEIAMPTKEAVRALKCLDVLVHRRDDRGLIAPVASSAMLRALDEDPRAGVALGQARSLLDYVCLEAGVPLMGQLIVLQTEDPWDGAWSEWTRYRRLLACAPRLTIWRDSRVATVRQLLGRVEVGAAALWLQAEQNAQRLLEEAVETAQVEIERFVQEGLHAPTGMQR
jgi:hypothetical protein